MEKTKIEELAMAVAMVNYYNQIIENSKDEIRSLTEEEIAKINESNDLIITRQSYTKTIYSKEFNEELAKLKVKYPPAKKTINNHTIKLTATAYTESKRKLITDKFASLNKTQLKAASKTRNKR